MSRKYTIKLLEMLDGDVIDPKIALEAALAYMSEDEVEDMMRINGMLDFEDEDMTEDEVQTALDSFGYPGSRYHY